LLPVKWRLHLVHPVPAHPEEQPMHASSDAWAMSEASQSVEALDDFPNGVGFC
jgi:hypothetical protein